MNIKNLLVGRYYVLIAPPSMYITRPMTLREVRDFAANRWKGPYYIVRDMSGAFTRRYVKKTWPIDDPFDGAVIILK